MPGTRFSLRALFIFMTVATIAAWQFSRPTLLATRYVEALNGGDFDTAREICDEFPGQPRAEVDMQTHAMVHPISWIDFASRQRRISVGITYTMGDGMVTNGLDCIAKNGEIEVGVMMP